MSILSIDLAYKNYRDIGVAILEPTPSGVEVEFRPFSGTGAPEPVAVAKEIIILAENVGAPLVLIDGPQGWKDPSSPFPHSRICERILNTPAKTGLPGCVKPAAYTSFVSFSIHVFDALHERGWTRFSGDLTHVSRTVVESFPLSAWRSLGLPSLPAKQKARPDDIASRLALLVKAFHLSVSRVPNHDELQALVSGLAGVPMLAGNPEGIRVEGVAPFVLDGRMREGFIVNPRA